MTDAEKTIARLKAKLARRDRKIAGLQRGIAERNHALVTKLLTLDTLPLKIERAVQHALCNVRLIPVLGIGGSDKIVEVRASKPESNT